MKPLKKKILVFGFTAAAIELGVNLRQKGYDFRIIDKEEPRGDKAEEYGFDLKLLDYTDDELLEKEGIGDGVEVVYALFPEDSKNIFLTISVRALDPTVKIIAMTQTHDTIHKLKAAGADTVLDPYQISGRKIYETIKKPEVVQLIDDTVFGRADINIEQFTITEASPLNGQELEPVKGYDLIILGVHDQGFRDGFVFVTEGHRHTLDEGDVVVLVGKDEELSRFRKEYKL